jgi:hypothetical protein
MDRRIEGRKSRRTHRAEELTQTKPQASPLVRYINQQRSRIVHLGRRKREPELSRMLSGIAAHCDPTVFGRLGGESRTITGAAHVKPSREVRISSVRQYSSGRVSCNAVAQRDERRRGLSFLSEKRGNACWKPLVLSRRSRHQTPLLVSSGSRRNPPAHSRAVLPLGQENFSTTRDRYAAFGIRRSRRTTRAAKLRTAYWRVSLNPDDAGGRCTFRQ